MVSSCTNENALTVLAVLPSISASASIAFRWAIDSPSVRWNAIGIRAQKHVVRGDAICAIRPAIFSTSSVADDMPSPSSASEHAQAAEHVDITNAMGHTTPAHRRRDMPQARTAHSHWLWCSGKAVGG